MKDIRPELLDELLSGYEKPSDLLGEDGIFRELKKRLLERALNAELSEHLGYEKGQRSGRRGANTRNGHSGKTVLTDEGSVTLAVPRDRDGTFDPAIVPKGVTRLAGFDAQIISLYARGLTVRDVAAHLRQMYQVEVSPDLISRVTDAVHEDVLAWRNRPLERVYPVVFLDALRVKIRHEGVVRNKAVYVALALTMAGEKEVLGLWVEQTEGARFWLGVLNELKARGVEDILIAVVDGLKGFPEAIEAVFPQAMTQTCIVHTIRTQSTSGRRRTIWSVAAGRRRWAQWDDMAYLQAAVADNDALDDELQDRLLVGERRRIQTPLNAPAESRQVRPHRLGAQVLLADLDPLLLLPFQGQALGCDLLAPFG